MSPDLPRCPACGSIAPLVWVHGHGQCSACGTNVAPCCDGAPSDDGRQEFADPPPRVTSLPPILGPEPRLLILGSMPGEASLRRAEYYAHPQNAFWRIAGELFGARPELSYEERVGALMAARVALWDVVHTCRREGSADAAIFDVEPNAIDSLLREQVTIEQVLCNGIKAHELFLHFVAPRLANERPDLVVSRVPSTSPAHATLGVVEKLAGWRRALVPFGTGT